MVASTDSNNNQLAKLISWFLLDTTTPSDNNKRYFLTTNENSKFIFIGKSSDCDIRLNYLQEANLYIEDQHALLFYDNYDNKLQIKDLSSVHGTYVNDIKLIENNFMQLEKNDIIRLAHKFEFQIDCIEQQQQEQEQVKEQEREGKVEQFDKQHKLTDDLTIMATMNQLDPQQQQQSEGLIAISTTQTAPTIEANGLHGEQPYDLDDNVSEAGTYTIEPVTVNGQIQDEKRLRTEAIDYLFGVDVCLGGSGDGNGNGNDGLNGYLNLTESVTTTTESTGSTESSSSQRDVDVNGSNGGGGGGKKRQLIKYSNRIKKTLTYDVIRDNIDDTPRSQQQHEDDDQAHTHQSAHLSLCNTELLMGDTSDLIRKMKEKQRQSKSANGDMDALSTRAVVNDEGVAMRRAERSGGTAMTTTRSSSSSYTTEDDDGLGDDAGGGGGEDGENSLNESSLRCEMGGLAFNVDFEDLNQRLFELKRSTRSKTIFSSPSSNAGGGGGGSTAAMMANLSTSTPTRSSFDSAASTMATQNTKSLGARIQENAQKNIYIDTTQTAETGDRGRRLSIPSPQSPQQAHMTTTSTNRALLLRQQSARAKRDALSNSPKSVGSSLGSALSTATPATGSRQRQTPTKSPLKESYSCSAGSTTTATTPTSSSIHSRLNRKMNSVGLPIHTSSRSQSPAIHTPPHQHSSTAARQISLNSTNLQLAAAKDAFQKRKNYDPMKSRNDEKLKRTQQTGQGTRGAPNSQANANYDLINQDLCVSIQNLRANISNTNQDMRGKTSSSALMASGGGTAAVVHRKSSMKQSKSTTQLSQLLDSNAAAASTNEFMNHHTNSSSHVTISKRLSMHNGVSAAPSVAQKTSQRLARTFSLKQNSTSTVALNKQPVVGLSIPERPSSSMKLHQQQQQFIDLPSSIMDQSASNTYENLLKSTVQRLCIRLIQMSTSVLDKIGDAATNASDDLSPFGGASELERMQNLAKLVHSMQLLNDHVQVIDSTLNTPTATQKQQQQQQQQDDGNYIDYV